MYLLLSRAVAIFSVRLLVQPGAAALGHAQALAVFDLDSHSGGLAVLGVHEHHVGHVDRPLALDDPSRLLTGSGLGGTLVALDDVEPFNVEPLLLGLHAEHLALL